MQLHTAQNPFSLSPRSASKPLASSGQEKQNRGCSGAGWSTSSSVACIPRTKVRCLSTCWVATVSREGSGWEVDAIGAPWSSVHALQDGHAAVITGAALQRRLLLHAPRYRVESERFVRTFPVLVSATQDVNLPSAHRQATALLESRGKSQKLRSKRPALGNGAEQGG